MKTLKQLSLALLIAAATFGYSQAGGNGYKRIEKPSELKSRVESMLNLPAPSWMPFTGEIDMLIRVNETGRLELVEIEGDHDYMLDQVRYNLDNRRIDVSEDLQGRIFRMTLQYTTHPQ